MDLDRLTRRIEQLFEQSATKAVMPMHDRFLCKKYTLETTNGRLFVKQYRNMRAERVAHIGNVETFFFNQGFPVVRPLVNREGQSAFYEQGYWFRVFPFIDAAVPATDELTDSFLFELGQLLARIHQVGVAASHIWAPTVGLWCKERFDLEYVAIKKLLREQPARDLFFDQISEGLERKRSMIRNGMPSVMRFNLSFDCLLYGDFLYQNTFIDEHGNVNGLYDLDLSMRGPRAYEVGRSLLIQAFDNGWNDAGIELGRAFFAGYQSVFPITRHQFEQGIKMYMSHTVHHTYLEARYALGDKIDMELYGRHMRRVGQWGMDLPEFCDSLFGD